MGRRRIVQHGHWYEAIFDGDKEGYVRAIKTIETFRQMVRLIDQRKTNYDIVTARYRYDKKYGIKVVLDQKESKRRSLAESQPATGKPPTSVDAKNGPLGSQKQFWDQLCEMVAEAGGPRFASHMFEQVKHSFTNVRNAPVAKYGGARRSFLVEQGVFSSMSLEHYAMPVTRCPKCNAIHATLFKGPHGITIRLNYGYKDEDYMDLVLDGRVPKEGGGFYEQHIRRSEYRWYVLDRLLAEAKGWSWQTPTVNLFEAKNAEGHKVTKFKVTIQYRRPARPGPKSIVGNRTLPDVDRKRVCEVVWDRVPGHMLKKDARTDAGTDDQKTFVIHALAPGKSEKSTWGKHIFVDGIMHTMRDLQKRKQELGLIRDGRRRIPPRIVRPIKDTLAGMAKTRVRHEKHFNCCWSKDIVFFAMRARCGTIKLYNVPDGATKGLLLDGSIPWGWSHFVKRVQDVANEKRIRVKVVEDADVSALLGELSEKKVDLKERRSERDEAEIPQVRTGT